jgi:hypothetical protein
VLPLSCLSRQQLHAVAVHIGRKFSPAFDQSDSGGNVAFFGDENGAIHVDVIQLRKQLGDGADTNRAFGHAADHHFKAELPRPGDHPASRRQTSRLTELDVDPVKDSCASIDVGLGQATLVYC